MKPKNRHYRRLISLLWGFALCVGITVTSHAAPLPASSISYATRIDAVQWSFSGSKFACELSHYVEDFGIASFERKAGETTRFYLQSQSPRMKSGEAALVSQPPSWINNKLAMRLAMVPVKHGINPVTIDRQISERMLAELQKGMDILFVRQPWYGDEASLTITVPSVGFRKTHSDYLECLGGLLPVNFEQVEKRSLYYDNSEEKLTRSVERYLDKLASYVKEDPAVKVIYIDGHTDSEGVRSENLLKSKVRAERVMEHLLKQGVGQDKIVMRWHGERYQVATNQNAKGRAKNRRVTIRLSKNKPSKPARAPINNAQSPVQESPSTNAQPANKQEEVSETAKAEAESNPAKPQTTQ